MPSHRSPAPSALRLRVILTDATCAAQQAARWQPLVPLAAAEPPPRPPTPAGASASAGGPLSVSPGLPPTMAGGGA
jgi:hypothetical protein